MRPLITKEKHLIAGVPFISLILLLLLASCSRSLQGSNTAATSVVFPQPPDTARVQYLTSISNSTNVTGKQSAFKDYVVGKEDPMPIIKPYGIHSSQDRIYICDVDLKGLEIVNLKENTFEYFIPTGSGSLQLPINCYVDEKGYLYVADAGRMTVVIFDENLQYVNVLSGDDDFKPTDVAVNSGKIWVANIKGGVLTFDQETLKLQEPFHNYKPGEKGNIYQPTNIWVTDDEVYVSDFGEFNVKVYDQQGNYLRSIGSYGSLLGQFVRPKGIAVDKNSNLFVVDGGFENTQIFNKDGKLMMWFGGPYKGPGYMWLPVKVTLDYYNVKYFEDFIDPKFEIEYLIYVTNQYGPDKVNVYGFIKDEN